MISHYSKIFTVLKSHYFHKLQGPKSSFPFLLGQICYINNLCRRLWVGETSGDEQSGEEEGTASRGSACSPSAGGSHRRDSESKTWHAGAHKQREGTYSRTFRPTQTKMVERLEPELQKCWLYILPDLVYIRISSR